MNESRGAPYSSDGEDGEEADTESRRPNIDGIRENEVRDVMDGRKGAAEAAYGSDGDDSDDRIEESEEKAVSEAQGRATDSKKTESRQRGRKTAGTKNAKTKSVIPSSQNEKQDEAPAVPFKLLCRDDAQIVRIFNLIPHDVYTGWKEQRELAEQDVSQNVSAKGKTRTKKARVKGKKLHQGAERPELQRKLEEKIAQMRAARLADDKDAEALRKSRKRKRQQKRAAKAKKRRTQTLTNTEGQSVKDRDVDKSRSFSSPGKSGRDNDIEFGVVKGFDEDLRKGAKVQRSNLKSQLRTAEVGKQKEAELKSQNTEEAKSALNSMRVEKALLKATGVTVKDDPKRIKKTLKRQAKKKEKSRRVWDQRKKEEVEEQAKRQERRKKNLKERKANRNM